MRQVRAGEPAHRMGAGRRAAAGVDDLTPGAAALPGLLDGAWHPDARGPADLSPDVRHLWSARPAPCRTGHPVPPGRGVRGGARAGSPRQSLPQPRPLLGVPRTRARTPALVTCRRGDRAPSARLREGTDRAEGLLRGPLGFPGRGPVAHLPARPPGAGGPGAQRRGGKAAPSGRDASRPSRASSGPGRWRPSATWWPARGRRLAGGLLGAGLPGAGLGHLGQRRTPRPEGNDVIAQPRRAAAPGPAVAGCPQPPGFSRHLAAGPPGGCPWTGGRGAVTSGGGRALPVFTLHSLLNFVFSEPPDSADQDVKGRGGSSSYSRP